MDFGAIFNLASTAINLVSSNSSSTTSSSDSSGSGNASIFSNIGKIADNLVGSIFSA